MSSGKSRGPVAVHRGRPGEGHAIELARARVQGSVVTFAADLGDAPVPDRQYPCDAIEVIPDQFMVKILCGQRKPVGDGLLSMLVVQMAYEHAKTFIESVEGNGFESGLRAYVAKAGPAAKPTHFMTEAAQTVILTASIVIAGHSGGQGAIDFYYASPFSVETAKLSNKLHIEPVVRVNLPAALMLAIIEGVRNSVPDHVPTSDSKLPVEAGKSVERE